MIMKKYNKEIIKTSIGAAILPVGMSAIDNANLGTLGTVAKTAMVGGFVSNKAKKFLR